MEKINPLYTYCIISHVVKSLHIGYSMRYKLYLRNKIMVLFTFQTGQEKFEINNFDLQKKSHRFLLFRKIAAAWAAMMFKEDIFQ